MDLKIDRLIEKANEHRDSKNYIECAHTLSLIVDFYEQVNNINEINYYTRQILECFEKSAEEIARTDFIEAAERWCGAACLAKRLDLNEYKKCITKTVEFLEAEAIQSINSGKYLEAGDLYKQAGIFIREELKENDFKNYYTKAIHCYEKILKIDSEGINNNERINNYLRIAQLYDELKDSQTAINFHDEAIKIYNTNKECNSYGILAKIYQNKANCLEKLHEESSVVNGLIQDAISFLELEANLNLNNKEYLKAAENLQMAVNLTNKLGEKEKYLNLIKKEATCYQLFAELLEGNDDLLNAARVERDAAYCYYKLGEYKKTADLLVKAAKQLELINDNLRASENYRDACFVHEHLGKYEDCVEYAYKSGLFAKMSNDHYQAIQNFQLAVEYSFKTKKSELINESKKELTNCLLRVSLDEEDNNNFHLSGTYLIEASFYTPNRNDRVEYLQKAAHLFIKAADTAISDSIPVIASYSLCCAGLVLLLLDKSHELNSIFDNYPELNNELYLVFLRDIADFIKNKHQNHLEFIQIKDRYNKIISKSTEIQNLLTFIQEKYKFM